jgi:hypothetical protein
MQPIVFTCLNEWSVWSAFYLLDRDGVIAVEQRPDDDAYKAVLTLTGGAQVKVKETAEEALRLLHPESLA